MVTGVLEEGPDVVTDVLTEEQGCVETECSDEEDESGNEVTGIFLDESDTSDDGLDTVLVNDTWISSSKNSYANA